MQLHTKTSYGDVAHVNWDIDFPQLAHASPKTETAALPEIQALLDLYSFSSSDQATSSDASSSYSASTPHQTTPASDSYNLPFEMDLNAFFATAPETAAYPLELAFSQHRASDATTLGLAGLNDVGIAAAFGRNFAGNSRVDDRLAAFTADNMHRDNGISPHALLSPPECASAPLMARTPSIFSAPSNTPLATPNLVATPLPGTPNKRKQSSSSFESSGSFAKKVKASTPAPSVTLTKRKARPAGGAARKVVPQKYIVSGHAQRATGLSEAQLRSFPTFEALLAAVPPSHKALAQDFGGMIEAARLKACGATKESREKREREMMRLEAEAKRWQDEYHRLREWVGALASAGAIDQASVPVLAEHVDDDEDDE